MKLNQADIDRLTSQAVPDTTHLRNIQASDYIAQNAAARDSFLESLTSFESTSTAKNGEILPPSRALTTKQRPIIRDDQEPEELTPLSYEAQLHRLVPHALRGTNLSAEAITSRADLIAGLTINLPLNELQLPRVIYRADLLDWRLFVLPTPIAAKAPDALVTHEAEAAETASLGDAERRFKVMQDYLDASLIHLSYAEGFPALPDGTPLWAKLPHESPEHYAAFTDYCTQSGMRQVARLQGAPQETYLQWFHEDYWSIRAKCYDMVGAIHAAKQRERRILSCEDDHYQQAAQLFQRLKNIESEVDWDYLKEDPKEFVNVLEKIIKLQRLSVGLMSSTLPNQAEAKIESLEMTMRKTITPEALEAHKMDDTIDIKRLLKNPDALATAQELVIRMTRSTETHSQNDGIEAE